MAKSSVHSFHSEEDYYEATKKSSKTCYILAGVAFALIVTGVTIGLILHFVVFADDDVTTLPPLTTTPEMTTPDDGKTPFGFDDMFDPTYNAPRSPNARWVGENNMLYYFNSEGDVVLFDVDNNTQTVALKSEVLSNYSLSSLSFSEDLRYILIGHDAFSAIQDWVGERYVVYDREDANGPMLEFPNNDAMRGERLEYAAWAPTGHGMTFVFAEDLYYVADPHDVPERLTMTGESRQVRNGISYWNFRGVLWDFPATWWSPDLTYLAYGSFNSSEIYTSEHPVYGEASRVYPYLFNQVYLKAGDPDHFSHGALHLIDMTDPGRPEIIFQPPDELAGIDHYFYQVVWQDSTHVAIAWCNRQQNHSITQLCDVPTRICQMNHEELFPNGWIKEPPIMRFIEDGDMYIAHMPYEVPFVGPFEQVAIITANMDEEGNVTYLTTDSNEVHTVVGYDSERHIIFYEGTNGNQLTRHLFRVGTPSADPAYQAAACLTCDVNEDCQYVSTSFSYSAEYFLISCLGPGVPKYQLRSTYSPAIYTIEDNAALAEALESKRMPERQWTLIDLGDGYQGWAEFILPPNMVKDGSVKYPMILYPYAGPHGHTQADYAYKSNRATSGGWENYLSSSEEVIGVRINGRGSGGRGDAFLYALYRRLGTFEIEDQIEGAKSIAAMWPYVDADRIAIWGWSYGGFTASHVIGHPSNVINCGLAVAPVTNFRYYYSGYTERYMNLDLPEDNAAGYDGTDVMKKVANFHGKNYFIAHGTLDDNVHFQNAMQLVKALAAEQVLFKQEVYVDQNHQIPDYYQYRHLFLSMTDFLLNQCGFKKDHGSA